MRTTLVVGVMLVATPALAEFTLAVTASESQIGTDDLVEIRVSVTDPPPGVTIDWPTSPDFAALKRTSTSQNKSKDGAITFRSELRAFKPLRDGSLEFPAVKVQSPLGTSLSSHPLKLTVIKGHVSSALRVKTSKKAPEIVAPKDANGVFLHAALSSEGPALGDVVHLRLSLFARKDFPLGRIDQIELGLNGFAVDEQGIELEPLEHVLGGVEYREYPLRNCRLLAFSTGTWEVKARAQVRPVGDGAAPMTLTAPVPSIVVQAADDARTSFTQPEAIALLSRKLELADRQRRSLRAP